MRQKQWILALAVIILVAVLLRGWGIAAESYWLDESISIRQAQEGYGDMMDMVKSDIHLPLYIITLHHWMQLFGTGESATRSLSLVYSVLALVVFFFLAELAFDKRTALIAASLFALSPLLIYYAQEARLYSLFLLLTLCSAYLAMRYLNDERPRATVLALYVLSSILMVYTYLFAFLMLFVLNLYALYRHRKRLAHLKLWMVAQALVLLAFLPWISVLLRQVQKSLNTNWIQPPNLFTVGMTVVDFFGSLLLAAIGITLVIWFLIACRKRASHKERHALVLIGLWAIVPFAIVLTYSALVSPIYHTRYMLFVLPAILLLMSVAITGLLRGNPLRQRVVVLLLLALSLSAAYQQTQRIDKDDWRGAARFIRENRMPGEPVFIAPFYQQDPFTYYYDPQCFKDIYLLACNSEKNKVYSPHWQTGCCDEKTPMTLSLNDSLLGSLAGGAIWLVQDKPELYNANDKLYAYLAARKKLETAQHFSPSIMVYRFS